MSYLKLVIPPGISKDGTEYQSQGRWWDQSLTRWTGDALAPIGGWQAHSTDAMTGTCRALLAWRATNGNRHLIGGTNSNLYHFSTGGNLADITPTGFTAGAVSSIGGTGYGGGSYGSGLYGVARPDVGVTTEAAAWMLAHFGQIALGCMEGDGYLYEWTPPTTATLAAVVTNAPTDCSGVFVTDQRAVVALGASADGRNVAWSDLEDRNDWTPTATNQAGDFTLNTDGSLIWGGAIGSQNLLITTVDAHLMSYEGLPYVYVFNRIATGCGAMSKGSVVNMGQQAMWWGRSGFWLFNGGSITPLACDVLDYLRVNLNKTQRAKIAGFHNADYGEAWWFYASVSSSECDSYVLYDYINNRWGKGSLGRTAGVAKGIFEYPILADTSGILQEHETGQNYDSLTVFAETGPLEIGAGDNIAKIQGIIGDEHTVGQCQVEFFNRDFPNSAEVTIAAVTLDSSGYTDLRFCTRSARMRVIFATITSTSRFGTARLDVISGGKR